MLSCDGERLNREYIQPFNVMKSNVLVSACSLSKNLIFMHKISIKTGNTNILDKKERASVHHSTVFS